MTFQLDFFEEVTDVTLARQEARAAIEAADKLRRSFFARQAGQDKEIMRLSNELEQLRAMLLERKK